MSDGSPAEQGNAAQIAYWNDRAAVTWTSFQERIDAVFAPITKIAIDAAAPEPADHVIDVGCGCGTTVLLLAQRVGPTGRVLGVDVSVPMAARALDRIRAERLANAAIVVSDAATHKFAPGRADLLFSRFGVMFFADPLAAFANLRAGMRPGRRLLFAAWRPLAENAWFTVPLEAGRPLLPPQPESDPTAPGPFAFADLDYVRGILQRAGWKHVNAVARDVSMQIAASGQLDAATEFATRVGPLARRLAEADPQIRLRVREAVRHALEPHEGLNGIVLGGAIWLVSAVA